VTQEASLERREYATMPRTVFESERLLTANSLAPLSFRTSDPAPLHRMRNLSSREDVTAQESVLEPKRHRFVLSNTLASMRVRTSGLALTPNA